MTGNCEEICFLDSNIWIYAFAKNQETLKREIAIKLINYTKVILSTQVINEVCVNLIKKSNFTERQILRLIHDFYYKYSVVELNQAILISASDLRINHAFSFWDSLIIASAVQAEASILYSKDMQDGLVVSNQVEIVNPFN
ncbi:MAG: PIN domain-containing protein [Chroococcidiopsidaceae cyanobacterium CP_BM_ER_R8_30]|nr:PIN domain-containing protein [Chroococcidiopsidaceae cyanobacterium CP_BM_ER_R8_30]